MYPTYRVRGRLSRSKQAIVYQAYRADLIAPPRFIDSYVVIKALYGAAAENVQSHIEILSSLNHYAVPRLLDSLEENARPYLVFEYISGIDTTNYAFRWMKDAPMLKIIEWAIDLCSALS